MINHARSLLVNRHHDGRGAEYVPQEYRVRCLTQKPLGEIWDVLFGDADAAGRNYRARQLMTILHSTDLAQYVYDMDPRVTYWPSDQRIWEPAPDGLIPLHKLIEALEPIVNEGLFSGSEQYCLEEFERIWREEKLFTRRLSALLLAFIYRVEEIK
jgi:hypothetical protein